MFLIFVAVFIGAAVFVALTYTRFHREAQVRRVRLLAGSDMLKTDHGDIEYSVQGDGTPVLSLHGAGGGYDQGLWAAKMAFDDGYKIVSISRYGYLRTPIPKDASIKTQAGLYKDLLDCLNISKVIVFGVSAGGPSATQFANDYPERTQALVLLSAVSEAAAPGDKPAFYVGIIIHLIPAIRLRVLVGRQVHATNYTQPDERQVHTRPKTTGAGNARYDASYDRTLSRHSERRGMIQRKTASTNTVSAPTLILHGKDDALVCYPSRRACP